MRWIRHRCTLLVGLVVASLVIGIASARPAFGQVMTAREGLPSLQPNDNQIPGGSLEDGVLTLALEAREGLLHPQGLDGPGFPVMAFGEVGGPLQIPGPLVRVPVGTEVRITVDNQLDRTLRIEGLHDRSTASSSAGLRAGTSHEFTFLAETPGTYYYQGSAQQEGPPTARIFHDAPLSGAIVVDPVGAPMDDRVLVVGLWVDFEAVSAGRDDEAHTFLINGLSWPFTQPLEATVGDSLTVRVINVSPAPHPMHLHGFYYNVEARGDAELDTVYTARQHRLAVTENMSAGTTMRFSWLPKREGHWLFHCHFLRHISAEQHVRDPADIVHTANAFPNLEDRDHERLHEHAYQGMAGLMMGVMVDDPEGIGLKEDDSVKRRELTVYANKKDGVFGEYPAYGYILQEGPEPPATDSVLIPGTPIHLQRDEPVEITVHNRTDIAITVHWHGIELDAYYDGIAGWSGAGSRLSPAIPAGESFVVRFTPDRAGTFIYHTHMEEAAQLASGLYAPLIVLEPGEVPDPATDHTILLGWGGPGPDAGPFLNGSSTPQPIELTLGKNHLLRFINITPSQNQLVRLKRGDDVLEWKLYGKDGARVSEHQFVDVRAEQYFGAGETYDFEITADAPGELTVEVTVFDGQPPTVIELPLIIR